ncbi:hypothetical protein TNCV_28061 [Trichonephila clavipes]|uniref:Uncharacterized protein n=1 Tax=Trichonephila clavipes TaxID=2585209 RepID=A0A8X7BLN4_TRICX|nr:hypothetical protein TNCV_28061 [Trichonephila clavipes]
MLSYTRAFGNGPRNFVPWSSEEDDALAGTPSPKTTPHQRLLTDLTCISSLHGKPLVVLGSNSWHASHDPIPCPLGYRGHHIFIEESVEDGKRSGCPHTSSTSENIDKVYVMVRKNRLQTIAESFGISSASLSMDTMDLNMHEVGQHITSRMLNVDQSVDVVKSISQVELKDRAKKGFKKCFDELYKPWQKCVVTQGSYFEKVDVFHQFNW